MARQQTLRATIAWSVDLLDPALETLFTLCGVFSGGWTTAAVATIGAGHAAPTTADGWDLALHDLADHNLIYRVYQPDGTWRFALLETIREYALEQLAGRPEAADWRARHAAYYADQVETLSTGLHGPHQATILDQIAADYENMRTALAERQAVGDAPAAGRLAAALWPFWQMRGYWSEGRQWLAAVLAPPNGQPARHARLTEGAGILALEQSAVPDAEAWLTQSWLAYQQVADRHGAARVLMQLGTVARLQSAWVLAEERLTASHAAFVALADPRGVADALYNLGAVVRAQGALHRAADYYATSLTTYRQLGDPAATAHLLVNLAAVTHTLVGPSAALPLLKESLGLYRQVADPAGQAAALNLLGVILRRQGDIPQATTMQQESLAIHRRLGKQINIGANLLNLGHLALDAGDRARAQAYYDEGRRVFEACEHYGFMIQSLLALGHLMRQDGDLAAAQRYYTQGQALAETQQSQEELAECRWGLGAVAAQRAAPAEACGHYHASLRLWHTLRDDVGMLRSLVGLGQVAAAGGEAAQATQILGGLAAQYLALADRCSAEDHAAYATLVRHCTTAADPTHSPAYACGQQQGWGGLLTAALAD